jgi:hypothetical protein
MKKIIKNKLWSVLIMIVCLCLLSPIVTNASPIDINVFKFVGVNPYQASSLHINGTTYNSIATGSYNLDLTVDDAPQWSGTYNNGFSFCVQDQDINPGNKFYDYKLYEIGAEYKNAAWLMDTYRSTLNPAVPHDYASLQVAIWETVFEGSTGSFDASSGNFYVTNLSGGVGQANIYLSALNTAITNGELASWSNGGNYRVASDRDGANTHQDFIVHREVPIPSAVLLLGSGLVGMVGIRRKYRG